MTQNIDVQFTQNGNDVQKRINGSLTNDTLNVVSPSTLGIAFVPTLLVNPNRITSENEVNTLRGLRGDLRLNTFGHLYDNLKCMTPNEGYKTIQNWFAAGGTDAVHTRILGIGNGIKNDDGTWQNSGFKLSDNNKKATIICSNYRTQTDYVYELLNLNVGEDISDQFFITNILFTPDDSNISITNNNNITTNELNIGESTIIQNELSLLNLNAQSCFEKPQHIDQYRRLNTICPYENDNYFYANYPLYGNDNTAVEIIEIKEASILDNIFDSFENKYTTSKTPWVTSQPMDRSNILDNRENIHEKVINLFRFFALDDGEVGNRFRIKINPLTIGNKETGLFSTFDLFIFEYEARDNSFTLLEDFRELNLDSKDENYIGRRIGTKKVYYDVENKKIYEEGRYENVSRYLRVEIDEDIENNYVTNIEKIVPSGFRSYPRLNIEKAAINQFIESKVNVSTISDIIQKYNMTPDTGNFIKVTLEKDGAEKTFTFTWQVNNTNSQQNIQYNAGNITIGIPGIILGNSNFTYYYFKAALEGKDAEPRIDSSGRAINVNVNSHTFNNDLNDPKNYFSIEALGGRTHKIVPLEGVTIKNFKHNFESVVEFQNGKIENTLTMSNNEVINLIAQDLTLHYLPPKLCCNIGNEPISDFNNSWGIEFYRRDNNDDKTYYPIIERSVETTAQKGKKNHYSPHYFYTRYMTDCKNNDLNIWVEDDNYLNSYFNLEKISSNINGSDLIYKPSGRNSSLPQGNSYIVLEEGKNGVFDSDDSDDSDDNRISVLKSVFKDKLSFDFFTYGGFDGTNIFDFEKKNMTDEGLLGEYYNESLEKNSPIYNAYKTGIDETTKYENCNGDVLIVPDISLLHLHRYAVNICENLKRYIYCGDIKGVYYDSINSKVLLNDDGEEISTLKYKLAENQSFGDDYSRLDMIQKDTYNFDSIRKISENILNQNINHNIYSRYFIPILGEAKTRIDSNVYYDSVLNTLVSFLPNNYNRSLSLITSDRDLFDIVTKPTINLKNEKDNTEKIKKKYSELLITGFTQTNSTFSLINQMTSYSLEYSVFSESVIMRAIQLVKKLIMVSIYADRTFIRDTFFFTNSSNYKNIYQLLKIQLNTLLSSLQENGIISGFVVNIDENYLQNNLLDVQNYKFSGNIIIQFGNSNIIDLELNNILSQLSILADAGQNESGYASVTIASNNRN